MNKSREHIKRFLSFYRPASEQEEDLICVYYRKRKIKIVPTSANPGQKELDPITFRQFGHWLNSKMPQCGDVVRLERLGLIGLVVREKWDSFIVGATLSPDGGLSVAEVSLTEEDAWTKLSKNEIRAFQKVLAAGGYDWNYVSAQFEKRFIPSSPQFVRLMVLGEQVGVGIFKQILPDNTLEMFCVKMGDEHIRYEETINLGDADYYSFLKTYDEHRALIQSELAAGGYIWNPKCHRIARNNLRARLNKTYYTVTNTFAVKAAIEKNSSFDRLRFNRGNYFLSRAVAERVRDRMLNLCKEEMLAEDNR